ncbi:MAG: NAD(P)/FAD-dependent oxidoreductase [Eubacteriales bacterium]|nr:NAD(P)/FAD-dependent oxidoreductase [Eubacteriales bacterium]
MHDLIIIGKGPAGLSAAVYAVRAGLSVLVIGRDSGALEKAEKIENYLGFTDPISGPDLLKNSLDQAVRLGVEVVTDEVTGVSWMENFTVHTTKEAFEAKSVVLSTGIPRRKASVKGLSDYEGKGVSYCATCDGFFYRGKTVAVIGSGEYALKEASELKAFAGRIVLLTNGREFEGSFSDDKIELDKRKIVSVYGRDEKVGGVELDDGSKLDFDGIFVAEGTASALDLALKLGLDNDGKVILTSNDQATNLPGVYAAGDCTGGLLQVAVAVGEGAKAGMSAAAYVKESRGEKAQKLQWGE